MLVSNNYYFIMLMSVMIPHTTHVECSVLLKWVGVE
jgi:hypothetical protein